ncbi:MAG TPA: phosphotransferase [Marmoricola sp.]|nr:phosphotransferase [Marmoricola sp.]
MSVTVATPGAAEPDIGPEGGGSEQALDRFLTALQPRIMGPRLAEALGLTPTACHVLDAKYLPGVGATVLYSLGGQLLRADVGGGPRDAGSRDNGVGALGMSIHPFPDDPDLPSLRRVMDPSMLGPSLDAALRSSSGTLTSGPRRCRTTLLRYRPGKRATVLVEQLGRRNRYVAKAYHDVTKAAAVARESDALTSVGAETSELRFAAMAAHLPDLGVVVQREVAGTPLTALVGASHGPAAGASAGVRRAARALAELHQVGPATDRHRSVHRELRRFSERSARVTEVAPEVGAALEALAARLADCGMQLPPPQLGTVHGDCKPSQFVLGRHVHLLDVDHLGVSDLAADVGTFLASLRQQGARRRLSRRAGAPAWAYDELAAEFLREYLVVRGVGTAQLPRIRWQEAVALERKALRAFGRAPCSPLPLALIALAHRQLDIMGGRHGKA